MSLKHTADFSFIMVNLPRISTFSVKLVIAILGLISNSTLIPLPCALPKVLLHFTSSFDFKLFVNFYIFSLFLLHYTVLQYKKKLPLPCFPLQPLGLKSFLSHIFSTHVFLTWTSTLAAIQLILHQMSLTACISLQKKIQNM